MSINELVKSLLKCRRLFLFLIAASILLSTLGLEMKRTNTAEIVIKYICDSAENGLTENGQQINPYEINSPLVVKNAVAQLGLNATNIDIICRNITIAPIIPTHEQEKYASWIQQFSDYEKNEEEKKNTVYYSVTYTTGEGKDYAKRMLSAIISQYRLYYVQNYTYSSDITNLPGEAAMQYDYYDSVDMLRGKINSNVKYLTSIAESDSNYRSPKTGYSLLDLATEYKSLAEQQLSVAERMIVENGITKNAWYLRNTIQKKITDAKYDSDLYNKKAETQKGLMTVYSDKNKQYLWDNSNKNDEQESESAQVRENVQTQYSQEKSVYDNLVLDYVNFRTDALNMDIDRQRYQEDIDSFPGGFSNTELKNELETILTDTCDSYNSLYTLTKTTINDYNMYKSAKSIKCISGVVAHKTASSIFYYAVAVVLAGMIGIVISILLVFMKKEKSDNEKES